MATSGGEQVRSRVHPMVPSARAEEECGGLATCACGSAARRLTAATLWGAMGGEDEPRETGWPQRARGWAPLAPWQGAAARPRARAATARASAWLASMAAHGDEWSPATLDRTSTRAKQRSQTVGRARRTQQEAGTGGVEAPLAGNGGHGDRLRSVCFSRGKGERERPRESRRESEWRGQGAGSGSASLKRRARARWRSCEPGRGHTATASYARSADLSV